MRTIGVIPARMGSSRFPGKPLAPINGISMLGHVYFRSRMSPLLDAVYIATCDAEICRYAADIGADCILTSPAHERASDRTAEAVDIIEARSSSTVGIVVMTIIAPMNQPPRPSTSGNTDRSTALALRP